MSLCYFRTKNLFSYSLHETIHLNILLFSFNIITKWRRNKIHFEKLILYNIYLIQHCEFNNLVISNDETDRYTYGQMDQANTYKRVKKLENKTK